MAGLFFCERFCKNVRRVLAKLERFAGRMIEKGYARRAEQHRIDAIEIVIVSLENLAKWSAIIARRIARDSWPELLQNVILYLHL